jgi:lipoprotein Spr
MKRYLVLVSLLILHVAFAGNAYAHRSRHRHHRASETSSTFSAFVPAPRPVSYNASTDSVSSDNLLTFAQTLLGRPYRPGSSDPERGFNFDVPRSSCEYDNVGEKISLEDAKPGDIILFKGTKSHHPHSIGHVGIVYSNTDGEVKFIHSTSGKEYCVTISAMDDTYKRRFVQVVRLLKQNDAAPVLAAQ